MPSRHSKSDAPGPLASDPRVTTLASLVDKPSLTLADYHRIGRAFGRLSRDPTVAVHGSKWRDKVAEAVGASASTLNKCLQLARLYKAGELGELERTGAKWGLITIALTIENADQRHRLLRQAVAGGWSDLDLRKHIQRQRGRLRGGGRSRRPFRSHGLQADASTLASHLMTIEKIHEQVWQPNRVAYQTEVEHLDEETREVVAELLAQLGDQLDRVMELLGQAAGNVTDYRVRIPGRRVGPSSCRDPGSAPLRCNSSGRIDAPA